MSDVLLDADGKVLDVRGCPTVVFADEGVHFLTDSPDVVEYTRGVTNAGDSGNVHRIVSSSVGWGVVVPSCEPRRSVEVRDQDDDTVYVTVFTAGYNQGPDLNSPEDVMRTVYYFVWGFRSVPVSNCHQVESLPVSALPEVNLVDREFSVSTDVSTLEGSVPDALGCLAVPPRAQDYGHRVVNHHDGRGVPITAGDVVFTPFGTGVVSALVFGWSEDDGTWHREVEVTVVNTVGGTARVYDLTVPMSTVSGLEFRTARVAWEDVLVLTRSTFRCRDGHPQSWYRL